MYGGEGCVCVHNFVGVGIRTFIRGRDIVTCSLSAFLLLSRHHVLANQFVDIPIRKSILLSVIAGCLDDLWGKNHKGCGNSSFFGW